MKNLITRHGRRETDWDCRGESWYRFRQEIDDLLATGRYTWAIETLRGIQDTVTKTGIVTLKQRQAVENIEAGLGRGR